MFSTDRISLLLGVGAIVVTLGVGTCSTNARIDDVNRRFDNVDRRFDDLSASVNRRFDDLSASVNRRFDQVRADIRELRADHVRFDERLRALEGAHSRFPGHALTPTGVMAIRCKQFHLPDL